jgi:hypothetical protein
VAVLDVVWFGPTSVGNGNYLSLQPAGSTEVVIHNVHVPVDKAVQFVVWDGTNEIVIDDDATYAGRQGVQWHCTNAKYYRVKNVSGAPIFLAADGVVTRA